MSTITADDLRAAAEMLGDAARTGRPVPPLTETLPGITTAEAYEIQRLLRAQRGILGRIRCGAKIGLTSAAMRQMLGVHEPDYALLTVDMFREAGRPIDPSTLIAPRAEAEIAFLLGRPLRAEKGEPSVEEVLAAVEGVLPAIEIVDSRIADWRIRLADTVADNASSALVVLGDRVTPVEAVDLVAEPVTFRRGRDVLATATGAAVLGNPARAVAWLARVLEEVAEPLRAGDVVMSGSLHAAVPVAPGDVFTAEFPTLGRVVARFGKQSGHPATRNSR